MATWSQKLLIALGLTASQGVEAQNLQPTTDNKTDTIENVVSVNDSIANISEDDAKARLQALVEAYKKNPAELRDMNLLRAMVVGDSLKVSDLPTDHLLAVSKNLTAEDRELMGSRQEDFTTEFSKRYFDGELGNEEIKAGLLNDILPKRILKESDVPMIVSTTSAEELLAWDANAIQDLAFKYGNLYNRNPENADKSELVAVLNSPIGKQVLDSSTGINLSIEQAQEIIADCDANKASKVNLQNLGMNREQLLAYSLDRNFDKLTDEEAAKFLSDRDKQSNENPGGVMGSIGIPGGVPLPLVSVLNNMENSADFCKKGLIYALDEKHLDISNSSKVFETGSEYIHSDVVRNVLDYSLGGKRQDDQKHVDNYMEIVNKSGYFLEAGLRTKNKNYEDAGRFISTEVSQRGGLIDRKSALFLATPSFVRPEGWTDYKDQMTKLESLKSIMGATYYIVNSNGANRGGAQKNNYKWVDYGVSGDRKIDGSVKEINDFISLFAYEFKQTRGEQLTPNEEKFVKEKTEKYSKQPYSPTFIDEAFMYLGAVKSGDQAKITEAAQNFEKNNGIKLPDKITSKDFLKQYDEIVGSESSPKIDNTIEGQKRELDESRKKRNDLIYKGMGGGEYSAAGLYGEKDFAYYGYFSGGHVLPQYYAGMLNDRNFNNNLFTENNTDFETNKKKLVGDFDKFYAENKGQEGTFELLAEVLNTDKGQWFLEGVGENISLDDFKKLEAMGITDNKKPEFSLAFNNAKNKAKMLADVKNKESHQGETAQLNANEMKDAFQGVFDANKSSAFASVADNHQQAGISAEKSGNYMQEVRNKVRQTQTPPRCSTYDAAHLFNRNNKSYS